MVVVVVNWEMSTRKSQWVAVGWKNTYNGEKQPSSFGWISNGYIIVRFSTNFFESSMTLANAGGEVPSYVNHRFLKGGGVQEETKSLSL